MSDGPSGAVRPVSGAGDPRSTPGDPGAGGRGGAVH